MGKYTCKCSPSGEYERIGKDASGDFILKCKICGNEAKLTLNGFEAKPLIIFLDNGVEINPFEYEITNLKENPNHGLAKTLTLQKTQPLKKGNWFDTKVS